MINVSNHIATKIMPIVAFSLMVFVAFHFDVAVAKPLNRVLTDIENQAPIQKNTQPGLAGQQLNDMLEKNKGKVIYLDFWASWCVPCRKSFPWMNKIQADYAKQNFTVISVNVDKEFELAQRFLTEMPASFPVIYDPNGELASKYQLQGMPSSFLVNRDGKFVRAHKGFFSKKIPAYETEIQQLLSNQSH